MNIKLELPSQKRKLEAIDYIKEFIEYKSEIHGTGGIDITDYDNWLIKTLNSHRGLEIRENKVPASTYFVINLDSNKLIGMVNIRHYLNDYLISSGSGHIGYSVRPTERRKGYATELLRKALIILKTDLNVDEVLVGCYKDNIGSKKTILKNGGEFYKEIIEDDGMVTLAYKIK